MHQDPPSSSPSASAGSSGIESLQQQSIRAFTWVLLLLVTPILAGLHLTELFLGRYDAALAAQGLAHLVTCLLILVVRPLRGRALVAIVVLAISALMILLHYGPTLTAGLLYFMAVLLGSLFFGGRAVTWILAVVLGSIFAAGAVHVYFGSSLGDSRIADPQRMGTWIRTALVSVPVLAILAVLVHWFFEGMKRNIRAAEVALARERAERGEKERMAEARHKAERALSEAQRQDLIGRLAASASHDLNNVLTAILGGVELAVLDLEAGKGDTAREMLEQIEAAAQRASAMGRQLLSFSRQQHTQPRNVDWHELVAGLRGLLHRLLPSNIALDTTVRDDVVVVFADPSQLEQLIMNLVVNARDAMPDGGRVSLLVENARGSGGGVGGQPQRRGHRHGHRRGRSRADLRSLLHDQGTRTGDRARPRDREDDRRGASGRDRGGLRGGTGDHFPDLVAGVPASGPRGRPGAPAGGRHPRPGHGARAPGR